MENFRSKISKTKHDKKSEKNSEKCIKRNSASDTSEEFEIVGFEQLDIRENVKDCKEEKERGKERNELEDAKRKRRCEFLLKDTLRCKEFLNKLVKAKTVNGKFFTGLLKCLDPMTGNMIIDGVDDNETVKFLIFQDTCEIVTLLEEDDSSDYIIEVYPFFNTKRLKNRMISFFKEQQIPVKEEKDESLIVFGIATINPPYEPRDCICDNPIMLEQTRMMVQNLQYGESGTEEESESEGD